MGPNSPVVPVILCGGLGTRLWPLSTKKIPKPFINIKDFGSLFSQALLLASELADAEIVIVSNISHQKLINLELKKIKLKKKKINFTLILEPESRNTAPAIAAACLYVAKFINKNAIVQTLAADHFYFTNTKKALDFKNFIKSFDRAIKNITSNNVILYGINPSYPSTSYGYALTENNNSYFKKIIKFTEKPNLKTAEKYILDGNYFWNSGMFIFKNECMLDAFLEHQPEIYEQCQKSIAPATRGLVKLKSPFSASPNISIDYAIIEKLNSLKLVQAEFDWQDLGEINTFYKPFARDRKNNLILVQKENIKLQNCKSIIVDSNSLKQLHLKNLAEILIIERNGFVVVCPIAMVNKINEFYKNNLDSLDNISFPQIIDSNNLKTTIKSKLKLLTIGLENINLVLKSKSLEISTIK